MSQEYDAYDSPPSTPPGTKVAYAMLGGLAVLAILVFIALAIRKHNASRPPVAQQTRQAEPQRQAEPRVRVVPVAEERPHYDRDDPFREVVDRIMLWWLIAIVLCILYVVLVVLLMAWVAKDCRNRGIDGGAVWVLVIFLTGVIGLLVYLASRPHGMLTACSVCFNQRLVYARTCPHCGNS
jgi:hypothetical protein